MMRTTGLAIVLLTILVAACSHADDDAWGCPDVVGRYTVLATAPNDHVTEPGVCSVGPLAASPLILTIRRVGEVCQKDPCPDPFAATSPRVYEIDIPGIAGGCSAIPVTSRHCSLHSECVIAQASVTEEARSTCAPNPPSSGCCGSESGCSPYDRTIFIDYWFDSTTTFSGRAYSNSFTQFLGGPILSGCEMTHAGKKS